jgi:hypothetical protein
VPSVLAADVVATLAARLDELARAIIAERDAAIGEQGEQWEEAGVVSARLEPADPGYAPLVGQPLLFSAADAVIGPGCRVDGLSLRAPLPGCGHQGLHPDFFPGHARLRLTAAQLVIARQYGYTSWARLRRDVAVVIRPLTSPRELARAFELIGARRAPALGQDRYFLHPARRWFSGQGW